MVLLNLLEYCARDSVYWGLLAFDFQHKRLVCLFIHVDFRPDKDSYVPISVKLIDNVRFLAF